MNGEPVFVVLTKGGLDLARRLAETLPGAEVHGLAGRVDGAAVTFIPLRATRETEISDDILGTSLVDATSGLDYAKLLYDAANLAVNQDIGFMRRVLDKLDSIQALYDVITQFQANYAKYP